MAVAFAATCVLAALCASCVRMPAPRIEAVPGADATVRTIAFNVSEDPHSLNPLFARSDDERQLAHLCFEMLLDVDERSRQVPALAVQVPTLRNGGISRDGRTITYHLRRDVRWQHGSPLTSHDVWFTWRTIIDPRSGATSTQGYDLIDAIDTPDSHTAVIHLRRAWAPAVATLFTYGAHPVPLLPAHALERASRAAVERFNVHPVCSGPFVLESWERSSRLVYRANPQYFRGRPHSDRAIANVIPDFNTDLMQLRAGELDWSLLSPAQRIALGRMRGIRFVDVPFAGYGALTFNVRHPPFDDGRLRRAIAQSIDRHRLSQAITQGRYPVAESDQPRFSWAHDPSVRMPAYDPSAADRGFDAAGWRVGRNGVRQRHGQPLEINLTVFPEGDTAVRTAVYVQEMLATRGVAVSIKRVTLAHFYLPKSAGGLLMSGNYDLAYFAWRSGQDPDDSDIVTCAGTSNFAGYCNGEVDALEARALSVSDQRERAVLYARVQRIIARDVPYLYLYAPTYGYAASARLSGFAPTPFSPMAQAWRWSKIPDE